MLDLDIKEIKDLLVVVSKQVKNSERKRPDKLFTRLKISDLKIIRRLLRKILIQLEEKTRTINIKPILNRYNEKIHKIRKRKGEYYITSTAQNKIFKRLEIFSIKELSNAIDNFSNDEWWMQHNAHRGIRWFFHSDDRIESFINLPERKQEEEEITDPAILKLKKLTETKIKKIFQKD